MKELGKTVGGDRIIGEPGSFVHLHETGFGTGHLTVRKSGEETFRLPVDTSVRDINEQLSQFPQFPIKQSPC